MMELIRPEVEAYAEAVTTPLAPHLVENDALAREALPYPSMLSGPVVARLLQALVVAIRPRLVVELGTYSGFSALAMAEVLPPGGRIVTCELADEHADFAAAQIDATPYRDRIQIRRGPGLDTMRDLAGPYDLVFIDADKEGYLDYYEAALPKLADHGVIVADNTLRAGGVLDPKNETDRVMIGFNQHVADDDRVIATLLTVRDGLTVIRKRPTG